MDRDAEPRGAEFPPRPLFSPFCTYSSSGRLVEGCARGGAPAIGKPSQPMQEFSTYRAEERGRSLASFQRSRML